MYFHYIVIINVAKQVYVYHYSSNDYTEMNSARDKFVESLHGLTRLDGMHMLKTNSPSFESVQSMDPYFKGMIEINDLDEFRGKYILYLEAIGMLKNV